VHLQLKSILFGFGLGMVFLSAVFLLAFRMEMRGVPEITEEWIEAQAEELGMVWPSEDTHYVPTPDEPSTQP